jgi:hypothetical protein
MKVWVADWYSGRVSGTVTVYSKYEWFIADLMDQIVWFNSDDIVGSKELGYLNVDDFVAAYEIEVIDYDRVQ